METPASTGLAGWESGVVQDGFSPGRVRLAVLDPFSKTVPFHWGLFNGVEVAAVGQAAVATGLKVDEARLS